MDFAGVDNEVATAESYHAAEALLDALKVEQQEAIIAWRSSARGDDSCGLQNRERQRPGRIVRVC